MSKTTQETKDVFSVYKHNVDRYFSEIEKMAPQYLQSITNFQQEYTTAWKNIIESAISLQKEFVVKVGINTNIPESFIKVLNDATEELIKGRDVQNKAILALMDIAHQNVRTFNDNVKTLTALNENILQSWIAACTPTRT